MSCFDVNNPTSKNVLQDISCSSKRQSFSPLEKLMCGEAVSTGILSFLELNSIHSFALCSYSCNYRCIHDSLWKELFYRFWSTIGGQKHSSAAPGFWKRCFVNAYSHEHDLWVTHWNCITPYSDEASLQPGRCCIWNEDIPQSLPKVTANYHRRMCPTCRYHPCLYGTEPIDAALHEELNFQNHVDNVIDPIYTSQQRLLHAVHSIDNNKNNQNELLLDDSRITPSNLFYFSTQYSLAKFCRRMYELCDNKDNLRPGVFIPKIEAKQLQQRASRAFSRAGANDRNIDKLDQYLSNGLNFLEDLVFFPIGEAHYLEPKERRKELYLDVFGTITPPRHNNRQNPSVSSFGPAAEVGTHSCHVAKLTNPHKSRPILFRIYIQRNSAVNHQCFTVHPVEGTIQPGHSMYIYFCVRSAGALLNYIFENRKFFGDLPWGDTSQHVMFQDDSFQQQQLPLKPFIIRYILAPPIPFLPKGYDPKRSNVSISDHLWETVRPTAIRTIHLAAHVHTFYTFESFQMDTLFPFDIHSLVENQAPRPPREILKRSPPYGEAVGCRPISPFKSDCEQKQKANELNASIDLELAPAGFSHEGDFYKTEKRCIVCAHDWGEYCERLGRLFFLRRLELQGISQIKKQKFHSLENLACVAVQLIQTAQHENTLQCHDAFRFERLYRILCTVFYDFSTACIEQIFSLDGNQRLPLSLLSILDRSSTKLGDLVETSWTRKPNFHPTVDKVRCFDRKYFDSVKKKRYINIASEIARFRANKRGMGTSTFYKLRMQYAKLQHTTNELATNILASLSILFNPASIFPYGVYDKVSSPSLVTWPMTRVCFFIPRSFINRKMNDIDRRVTPSDPDPEALEIILPAIKRTRAGTHSKREISAPNPLVQGFLSRPTEISNARLIPLVGNNRENLFAGQRQPRRRRGVNLVWAVSEFLGWELDERNAPIVDNEILRAAQRLSNFLACGPFLFSLVARWIMWITPKPYDSYLDDPSTGTGKHLRYLDCDQCAYGAILIILIWIFMERHLPYSSINKNTNEKKKSAVINRCQSTPRDFESESYLKMLLCLLVMLFSFCSVAPHFFLNLLNIFFCGVSMGMSLSIETLEMGREVPSLRPFSLLSLSRVQGRHLLIAALLVGQIIGSSGGVFFLAEFIVTSISFLLGGVATISTSAVESWLVFGSLSSAAFWGFLFSRIGLLDGIKVGSRLTSSSSAALKISLLVVTAMWGSYALLHDWKAPRKVMRRAISRWSSRVTSKKIEHMSCELLRRFCKIGDARKVRHYLAIGANPLVADELKGYTSLHCAAWYGHLECIQIILANCSVEREGPVNRAISAQSKLGYTALHLCVLSCGRSFDSVVKLKKAVKDAEACCRVLVMGGIDRNLCSITGKTALMLAEDIENENLVRLLSTTCTKIPHEQQKEIEDYMTTLRESFTVQQLRIQPHFNLGNIFSPVTSNQGMPENRMPAGLAYWNNSAIRSLPIELEIPEQWIASLTDSHFTAIKHRQGASARVVTQNLVQLLRQAEINEERRRRIARFAG